MDLHPPGRLESLRLEVLVIFIVHGYFGFLGILVFFGLPFSSHGQVSDRRGDLEIVKGKLCFFEQLSKRLSRDHIGGVSPKAFSTKTSTTGSEKINFWGADFLNAFLTSSLSLALINQV